MLLEELTTILRHPTVVPPLADTTVGIGYGSASPSFVAPTLRSEGDIAAAQVLLVVAPAAVGKSTVANEIAAELRAPLWNLATTQVGSNTFVGGLAQAFGAGALAPILSGLRGGSFLIVLDALDETHLRSGYQNLEAFVGDIADHVTGAARVSVVVLARVETALIAQLMLELAGVRIAVANLEYFDERAARHFLDTRLALHWSRLDRPLLHQRNAAAYREAVDRIFEFVYGCMGVDPTGSWDSDTVRTFLGYAPVLEAIADYLAVENLQAIVSELDQAKNSIGTGDAGPWGFLRRVVNAVVDREHDKVLSQLRDVLQAQADLDEWDDWDALYLEDEQVDRVLRRFFRVNLFSDRMPTIPMSIRDRYEQSLTSVADQHPFLADARSFSNVVFREYALAWALTLGAGSVREQARAYVDGSTYLASPLLARFMLGASPTSDNGLPEIRPSDVGLVYESLSGSAEREGEFLLLLFAGGDQNIVARVTRGAEDRSEAVFQVRTSEDPIRFPHRLAHAEVSVVGGVVLGKPGGSFNLGPDVQVITDILETPAAEYVILGSGDDYGVRLEAVAHVDGDVPPLLKLYAESPFVVSWDQIVHPWYTYRDQAPAVTVSPELSSAFADLISILRHFRKHGRDEFAKKKELIDNVVVGRYISDRTADARRLLQFMVQEGVLREARELYFADLGSLGMTWNDVVTHHITDQAQAFLENFLVGSEPEATT